MEAKVLTPHRTMACSVAYISFLPEDVFIRQKTLLSPGLLDSLKQEGAFQDSFGSTRHLHWAKPFLSAYIPGVLGFE